MNIPSEIIQKAIEGGWFSIVKIHRALYNNDAWFFTVTDEDGQEVNKYRMSPQQIVLSPDFWKALGKTLGWEHEHMRVNWGKEDYYSVPLWQFYAHRFYDLLLQGKDTTEFWDSLLTDTIE